jgi:peptidoglycan/xylan/chitin deacetylase (PgdA/CDA1 family)
MSGRYRQKHKFGQIVQLIVAAGKGRRALGHGLARPPRASLAVQGCAAETSNAARSKNCAVRADKIDKESEPMKSIIAAVTRVKPLVISGSLWCIALLPMASASFAQECPGNPQALGTSRVIVADPGVLRRVGTVQYAQTLPLKDHEVVLTFDDGPYPPTTTKVLDALAAQCVEANFFIVGERAKAAPELVRRAYEDGHTIGTHSQTHASLAELPLAAAEKEISDGFDSTNAALGGHRAAAPFFRAPYLATTAGVDQFLADHDVMLWSIDIDPEDWQPLSPDEVVERILSKLEKRHSGIVLMHDVQPHTAAAVPKLLVELKSRGYRIVHVVAGKAEASAGD